MHKSEEIVSSFAHKYCTVDKKPSRVGKYYKELLVVKFSCCCDIEGIPELVEKLLANTFIVMHVIMCLWPSPSQARVAENTLAYRQALLNRSKGLKPRATTQRGSTGEEPDKPLKPLSSHPSVPGPSPRTDGPHPMEEDGKAPPGVLRGLGGTTTPAVINPGHRASKPPLYPGGVSRHGLTGGRAGGSNAGGGDSGAAAAAAAMPARQAWTGQLVKPLASTSGMVYQLGSVKNHKVKAKDLPQLKRVRNRGLGFWTWGCYLVGGSEFKLELGLTFHAECLYVLG